MAHRPETAIETSLEASTEPTAPRHRLPVWAALAAAVAVVGASAALVAVGPPPSAALPTVVASSTAVPPSTAPGPQPSFLRGMTVSCPMYGRVWGSAEMTRSLRQLAALGVEWVSIHPYAGVRRDGAVRLQAAADTGYLARAVRIARDEGLRLFWKPHLAYWGSFAWRGDIEFGGDEAAWRRFFEGYRRFILDQARFAEAAGVPLFAVGTELEQTTHREAEWRSILAEVRRVYSGRITYAANWDRLDRVPFWDAVDLIGVQAYFPLAAGENPDRGALLAGWDRTLPRLAQLSRHHGKPVLFTEIGYNRSPEAARSPWNHRTVDTPETRQLRARLLDVALERLPRESFLAGMFWWKWMPGPTSGDRDFSMRAPEAREALARHWSGTGNP